MSEFTERASLAWRILRGKDGGIAAHAKRELAYDKDALPMVLDVVRVFGTQGHSGGSAPITISLIGAILSYKPIGPLMGTDDEWMDVAEMSGRPLWQNVRCGRVFREGDGQAYDIDGIVWKEPDGGTFTNRESRVSVTFPYYPKTEYRDRPVAA